MIKVSDSRIEYDLDKPDVMKFEGFGRVEYFEFENDIWINDVFADKRGSGLGLAKRFIAYARSVGKNIYGMANPQSNVTEMKIKRLIRWYKALGGVQIRMKDRPTAMKLEIR
jgi:hypothetical protein